MRSTADAGLCEGVSIQMMKSITVSAGIQNATLVGERVCVSGHLLECPVIPGLEKELDEYLYLAGGLDGFEKLNHCILLDDSDIFSDLLREKMPLTVGGRYGAVWYRSIVCGWLAKERRGPFPATLSKIISVNVWIPRADSETETRIELIR